MKRISFLLLLTTALPGTGGAEVIAVEGGVPAGTLVERNGKTTTVRLTGPARLDWSQFVVGSGETLQYISTQGSHATLNLVNGGLAVVDGSVAADGPFYLISPGGIRVGGTGHIQAPQVFLSALRAGNPDALLSGGATTFSGSGGVIVEGTVQSSGGAVVIVGSYVSLGSTARVRSPGGRVQVVAAGTRPVNGSAQGVTISPNSTGEEGGGSGAVTNSGWIEARRVELLSDGFVRNAGRLLTTGPGDQIVLAAGTVTHESRSDALISTTTLITRGETRLEGRVLNPNDGANPAATGGLRQTPRLSGTGFFTTVSAGQTQLSNAALQSARTQASPIPPPLPRTENALAARRRGSAAESDDAPATGRKPAPADTGSATVIPAKKSVRKAAFFGQPLRLAEPASR